MRMSRYRYRQARLTIVIIILSCTAVLMVLFSAFDMLLRPVIESVAQTQGKAMAQNAINAAVNRTMEESGTGYSDLIDLQKNNNGEVCALTSNIVKMNKLKARLANDIQETLNDAKVMQFSVPMGNLSGKDSLAGLGPPVKLRMVPVGFASIDMLNQFSSAGINQTKHEIYLKINVTVNILLPISPTASNVDTLIPIAQTIIVGNVPDSYTNIEGASGSVEDFALEISGD